MLNKKKILIVGLGLIGGSYAAKLSSLGFEVGAITKDQESIDFGLKNQYIAHGMIEVNKEYIQSFDVIIFALYPEVFKEWILKYGSYIKEGTIITDVTGVKRNIVPFVQDLLPEGVEFIASHPMAGREVYGVENSDKDLFKNANFIITPTNKNTQSGIDFCKELGTLLEFKNISIYVMYC